MNAQSEQIFSAALGLPEAERAVLAERLLKTLSLDVDELTDDELAAELERRRKEVTRGKVRLIPWSELRDEE